MRAIRIEGAEKSFGPIQAIDGMDLEMGEGINVILGRNGSGKSTLLRTIAGIIDLDDGRIEVYGKRPSPGNHIGMLFDHNAQWDSLSGYENAWFFARSYGMPPENARESIEKLMRRFGLWVRKDDPVSAYSYGMKRKLGLVQALAHAPRLLLMDEPSMGLDHPSRLSLYDLLRKMAAAGACIVLATNDVHEASLLADQAILMRKGKKLVSGSVGELIGSLDALTMMKLRFTGPLPLGEVKAIGGVEGASAAVDGEGISHVLVLASRKVPYGHIISELAAAAQRNGCSLLGLDVREPDLGDVFIKSGDEG